MKNNTQTLDLTKQFILLEQLESLALMQMNDENSRHTSVIAGIMQELVIAGRENLILLDGGSNE